MNTLIAATIERWLDSAEMARGSLHATHQLGEEFEQACEGSPLDGEAIRECWIPFRYGMEPIHEFKLRRLANYLRADATFTLAKMHVSGADSEEIYLASKTTAGCTLDLVDDGILFMQSLGM